jgi:TolA-binding protein
MLNPIITPPRVPLVDPNTGLISRAWYLFFLSLNNVANDVVNDPVVSPSTESLIASYDALLQTLTQEVQTQPTQESALDQIAELQKQIQALEAQIECPCTELTAELQKQIQALETQIECPCTELTAELQKQVDGLQLTPPLDFGTMAFQNIGVSGTVALAKITMLGADGSLTFTNGIITAYVAPT